MHRLEFLIDVDSHYYTLTLLNLCKQMLISTRAFVVFLPRHKNKSDESPPVENVLQEKRDVTQDEITVILFSHHQ